MDILPRYTEDPLHGAGKIPKTEASEAVSYTHLDVYKRQPYYSVDHSIVRMPYIFLI